LANNRLFALLDITDIVEKSEIQFDEKLTNEY